MAAQWRCCLWHPTAISAWQRSATATAGRLQLHGWCTTPNSGAQHSTAQRSVSDVPHLSSDSKHYAVEGEMSDRVTCVGALILHVPLPELQRYSTCVCLGLRMM